MKISKAEQAFNSIESPFQMKLRSMSAPIFNKKLKDMGYLNEKGVLTREMECKFLEDRKVITIHKRLNVKGLKKDHIDYDYSIIENALPYYEFYTELLSRRSNWCFFEEERMEQESIAFSTSGF